MAITTYTRNLTAASKTTLNPYVTNNLTIVGLSFSSGGNNSYSELGIYTSIDSPIPNTFGQIVRVTVRLSASTATGVGVASYVWYDGSAILNISPESSFSPGNSTVDITHIANPWYNSGQPVLGLTLDMVNSSNFGFAVGFFKSTSWNLGGTSNPQIIIEVDDAFSVNRRAIFTSSAELRTV
jgi:hypothetical protein